MKLTPEQIISDMIAKSLIIEREPGIYAMTPKGWLLSLRAKHALKRAGRDVE